MPKLLTPPTVEPVTLDQAKFAARLTGSTAFDAALPIYIQAAREIAEMQTGVRYMEQVWRSEFADWPADSDVIEVGGAVSAVAVSYWSTGGAWVTMADDDTAYVWSENTPGIVIGAPVGGAFPTLGEKGAGPRVRVDVTVGTDNAASVPAVIKTFIMGMVAYWIDNPQAYTDKPHTATPAMLTMLDTERIAF